MSKSVLPFFLLFLLTSTFVVAWNSPAAVVSQMLMPSPWRELFLISSTFDVSCVSFGCCSCPVSCFKNAPNWVCVCLVKLNQTYVECFSKSIVSLPPSWLLLLIQNCKNRNLFLSSLAPQVSVTAAPRDFLSAFAYAKSSDWLTVCLPDSSLLSPTQCAFYYYLHLLTLCLPVLFG